MIVIIIIIIIIIIISCTNIHRVLRRVFGPKRDAVTGGMEKIT